MKIKDERRSITTDSTDTKKIKNNIIITSYYYFGQLRENTNSLKDENY
jgi:hypothetical protein